LFQRRITSALPFYFAFMAGEKEFANFCSTLDFCKYMMKFLHLLTRAGTGKDNFLICFKCNHVA